MVWSFQGISNNLKTFCKFSFNQKSFFSRFTLRNKWRDPLTLTYSSFHHPSGFFCINQAQCNKWKARRRAIAGVDQVKYLELLSKKVINEVNWIEYCDSFDGLFIKSFKLHNLSGFIFAFFCLSCLREFSMSPDFAHILQVKMKFFIKEMWFGLNYFQGQALS